jgi:hypothetical protein
MGEIFVDETGWTLTPPAGKSLNIVTSGNGQVSVTGVQTQTITKVVASPALGTVRAIIGQITASGAAIISGNVVGVRGLCTLSGTITAGGAYLYGLQGKLAVTGTMNHADARLCAVIAQLDISAGTYSAGQLSALWVDAGASAGSAHDGGGQFNLIRITNTTIAIPNSVIFVYAEASYLFDLAGGPGGNADWYAANTTSIEGNNMSYILKVKDPAGAAGYIPVLGAVPS